MSSKPSRLIPVTVLTGFLGSGKTTLLNRILTENHGKKIAVIENEFGEVGVDNQLVISADEELFEMNNGCICCTVRGDLIRILNRLSKRKDPLDGVIIETTGLADPGPVAQTFFTDADVRSAYQLDAIVTIVDAKHIWQHIDEAPEAKEQIAFADVILLNKTDLVPATEIDALESRIKQMNRAAKSHRTQNAAIPIDRVLNVGGFNLQRATEVDPQFLEPEYPFEWAGVYELPAGETHLTLAAGPDPEMDLVLASMTDVNPDGIAAARDAAALAFSDRGSVVQCGRIIPPNGKLHRLELAGAENVFQLRIETPGRYALFTQHHPDEFQMKLHSEGRPASPTWAHVFKPDHEHDDEVASVGITHAGDLEPARLNEWISALLRTKGNDIFRMKGVLSVKGSKKRLVFQGVHMLFDATFDREWRSGEVRANTLIFIGRNLDREALNAGFRACLA